jgi:hypothetical protein
MNLSAHSKHASDAIDYSSFCNLPLQLEAILYVHGFGQNAKGAAVAFSSSELASLVKEQYRTSDTATIPIIQHSLCFDDVVHVDDLQGQALHQG